VGPQAGYQPIDEVDQLDPDQQAESRRLPILACETVRTVGAVSSTRPLYATADLDFRGGAMLSEVMSEGRLALGPSSRISGWAHAERELRLGESSLAVRRISSAGVVVLARGCQFERVHAPLVQFGEHAAAAPAAARRARTPADFAQVPGAVERTPGVWRVEGDCHLPEGGDYTGSLIVTGVLRVGAGVRVAGSVKAHAGVLLAAGSEVTGAVVCAQGVHVLGGAAVGGPLVSESHLLLAANARIGRPGALTTANAMTVVAEQGAVVHGTVWARRAGVVWGVG
jgi:hypothetical protein